MIRSIIPKAIQKTISKGWYRHTNMELPGLIDEHLKLNNKPKCYLGRGYYPAFFPPVLIDNVLTNPAWYTPYTPYQPSISQGRLEASFYFQTMISDLTQLPVANASLLDEATAAGEGMLLLHNHFKGKRKIFLVDDWLHPQNYSVLRERASHLGIQLHSLQQVKGQLERWDPTQLAGVIIQNPDTIGQLLVRGQTKQQLVSYFQEQEVPIMEVTDLLSCVLNNPPGENKFDLAVGSSQRIGGLPMWFGGPHAGFIAGQQKYLRKLPGRIVGQSVDAQGDLAYRLCLQPREQHIRKATATSNICTAQALLANLSVFRVMYLGRDKIKDLATHTHQQAQMLQENLDRFTGHPLRPAEDYFDSVQVWDRYFRRSVQPNKQFEFSRVNKRGLSVLAMHEMVTDTELNDLYHHIQGHGLLSGLDSVSSKKENLNQVDQKKESTDNSRQSPLLTDPIFGQFANDELGFLRYLTELSQKDYHLGIGMVPLGSCTMKETPSETLVALTDDRLNLHPYTAKQNSLGCQAIIADLTDKIKKITNFNDVSFQPAAGSQGEYAGLVAIRKYQRSLGEEQRTICLIPKSAHGTNFASSQLAGFEIQELSMDKNGQLDTDLLTNRLKEIGDKVAALMITYPSTYGLFDTNIDQVVKLIHQAGGQVYMDGANMNAQLGWTSPGTIGADVCHLNLHKTFAIPHGGGGPGVGPIAVQKHLVPFLPSKEEPNFAGAPHGSASILTVSWLYLSTRDPERLRQISERAVENANYLKEQLKDDYQIAFTHSNGLVGHEFIINCQPFKSQEITATDIASRLIDYEFHPPTLAWPIPNSVMVEPTETENQVELDRFVHALQAIRQEIDSCPDLLKNAPHPLKLLRKDVWPFKYSQQQAFYPTGIRRTYFPTTSRVNEIVGDRQPIVTSYQRK